MQSWYGFNGLNIGAMEADNAVSTITYTATNGIIGTPQQTQDGVTFRVLLDPRLSVQRPPMQVNIANASIRQITTDPRDSYKPILDHDGLYIVMGLQYVGDNRGNDWFTQIVGVTSVGGRMAMIAAGADPQLDRRSHQLPATPNFP
jgi:hypothetical protein